MSKQNLKIATIIPLAFIVFNCSVPVVFGETLTEKLEQQTDFQPQHRSPVEQLVEVAQKFKIPMAIEWLERPAQASSITLAFDRGTVLNLLEAIVRRSPGHHVVVTDRVVYVCPPTVVEHRYNFLNLRISEHTTELHHDQHPAVCRARICFIAQHARKQSAFEVHGAYADEGCC